ncbi:MAG: hypothetical protein PHO76_09250 [Methylotenera sp.]|nr:hypothetical protein [Methylotenera sp.]MDD4925947.1 hypothetical protein [Methylotenera sp.]
MNHRSNIVLVIGSAPDALRSRTWHKRVFSHIVAINNAWQVRRDWNFLIHPEDFPSQKRPQSISDSQSVITAEDYVAIQNEYGGFVYAGGTMAFTTAYWALGYLRPKVLAFVGCDMVYPADGKQTHFYGTGNADPLRKDVTLQSLEAKSARLFYHAHEQKCLCVNLTSQQQSRLVFPRVDIAKLESLNQQDIEAMLNDKQGTFDQDYISNAVKREFELCYHFESGRYWEHLHQISVEECSAIDSLWLKGVCSERDMSHKDLSSHSYETVAAI